MRDFNNETRAVIKLFFSLQGKAPKEIHAILTETLACFLPGQAKDLSETLYWCKKYIIIRDCTNTYPIVSTGNSWHVNIHTHMVQ